jgi:predicted PurR-regulated permease PerM
LADFGGRDRPASEVIMTTHIDRAALRRQIFFWLLAFAVVVAFLMVFRSILLPFIAGMALAYFLDPVADWFERRGFSRLMATFAILIAFIALFAIALIVLIPILVTQAADLGGKIPGYITQLQSLLTSETTLLPGWISSQLDQIKDSFAALLKEGAGLVGTIFQQIWNSGKALVDVAGLLVVTPVVAFYMLLDWDKMVAKVDSWMPRDHVDTVRRLGKARQCDHRRLCPRAGHGLHHPRPDLCHRPVDRRAEFRPSDRAVRGPDQLHSLCRLDGRAGAGGGVALVQFWPDWIMIVIVARSFLLGQFIEGNILQPKLVGDSVGLHPVWLMFALFAFGALFGFTGLLIAVPAAAAVGVLVRFAIEKYLDSDLYIGHSETTEKSAADE